MRRLIVLGLGISLSACAGKNISSDVRTPASQTQLGASSSQVFAVLEAVNKRRGVMFAVIQTIRVTSESTVEIDLNNGGQILPLRYEVLPTNCGNSDCPLKAREIQ